MTTSLSTLTESISLVNRVAEAIRGAIMSGEIAPGERLSVPDLARRLGVSRTPAREALLILERDGLVESRPRLGVVVLSGNEQNLQQLFELREALDGLTARLAARSMTSAERGSLESIIVYHEEAVARQDIDGHIAQDIAFHAALREGSRNLYLSQSITQIERQIMVLMRKLSSAPRAMSDGVIRDHRLIASAVERGDEDAAEAAARRHVRNVWAFYQTSLDHIRAP
ncbi:GntR family transcriptional regulator [Oryzicola mucosus]|uniref:GntR family transcriptional regulator n=1 Tax=Oryzicola mucosus TaxID=2767425 RepID=A0A8J6U5Q9_9HYPH|nr:GntR family transcriptional regulator [Oryzicola mucosus]MBD0416755.1 GntR family transcriptional regulator [Oryzicola mucosus]